MSDKSHRGDGRVRIGERAWALLEREAATQNESPNAQHLEFAIAKLEAYQPSLIDVVKAMNENVIRLGNLFVAQARVDEDNVLEAMKELTREIGDRVVATTKDTPFRDPQLDEKREELDRVTIAYREEASQQMTKDRSRESEDRER